MIDAAGRPVGAQLDLRARTEREAAFHQSGSRHGAARQPAGQLPSTALPGADPATEFHGSGLKLPARLLPAGVPGQDRPTGLPVELRLVDPGTGRSSGLVATVIGRTAERGLVLDLGGHRLTLQHGAAELPIGATATIQLQLPGSVAPVGEKGALDRLISAWLGGGSRTSAAATPAAAGATALVPDAGLAARLVADWRTLAGRIPGVAAPASAAGNDKRSSLELRIEGETGRSIFVDRDTGWRALFGLLGEAAEPAQPVTLWRRERGAKAPDDDAGQLLLTLDLSRFGRIVLQLDTAAGRLRLVIASAEPLPQPLRSEIAEALRAAAEIAGLEPALVFRAAPAAAVPLHDTTRDHLADWVG